MLRTYIICHGASSVRDACHRPIAQNIEFIKQWAPHSYSIICGIYSLPAGGLKSSGMGHCRLAKSFQRFEVFFFPQLQLWHMLWLISIKSAGDLHLQILWVSQDAPLIVEMTLAPGRCHDEFSVLLKSIDLIFMDPCIVV
jgi:hypothetical protein